MCVFFKLLVYGITPYHLNFYIFKFPVLSLANIKIIQINDETSIFIFIP